MMIEREDLKHSLNQHESIFVDAGITKLLLSELLVLKYPVAVKSYTEKLGLNKPRLIARRELASKESSH